MEDVIVRLSTQIPGFLFAIVFHEAAHAFVASRYGDPTARSMGRLTLNPMAHIDLLGTIVFPLLTAFGGVMFGWARPVPIDSRHFKNVRQAIFWVSFAGPLANILLAIISAFFLGTAAAKLSEDFYFFTPLIQILTQSVFINIMLATFNLIPIPPLDGSNMVSSFLPYNMMRRYESLGQYALLFFLVLMFTNAWSYILAPGQAFGYGLIHFFYGVWR
ncbi:MAG: site-2 protease family protein [Pseudomonadota bacterium]